MFDLGIQELVVIFVVALLVFGPKRLPELARNMGKGVAQLKKAMFDIRHEIDQEVGGMPNLDLDDLSLSSDALKRSIEEKAQEAVGYREDMLTNDEPAPGQEGGEDDAPEEDVTAGDDAAVEDAAVEDAAVEDDDAEDDDSDDDDSDDDDSDEYDTAEDYAVAEDDDAPEGDQGGDDAAAKEPDDPYGGLSAEERVDPEEDEQEHPGESRKSNA